MKRIVIAIVLYMGSVNCTRRSPWTAANWKKFMEDSPTRPPSLVSSPDITRPPSLVSSPSFNRRDIYTHDPEYMMRKNPHRPSLVQLECIMETIKYVRPLHIVNDIKDLLKLIGMLFDLQSYIIISATCSIQYTFSDPKRIGLKSKQIVKIPIYHINEDSYKELLEMQTILDSFNESDSKLIIVLQNTKSRYKYMIINAFNRFKASTEIRSKMINLLEELICKSVLDHTINLV